MGMQRRKGWRRGSKASRSRRWWGGIGGIVFVGMCLLFIIRGWHNSHKKEKEEESRRNTLFTIPHAYMTEDGELIMVSGPKPVPFLSASKKRCWEAYCCLNPHCPGRRKSKDTPPIFPHILPRIQANDPNEAKGGASAKEDDPVAYDDTVPASCPWCRKARKPDRQVERYWTPEAKKALESILNRTK